MRFDKFWGADKPAPYDMYRQRVRAYWEVRTAVRQVEMISAGLFPFNGSWLTERQIEAKVARLKQEDRALLGDFLVVAMAVLGFSALFIILIEFAL